MLSWLKEDKYFFAWVPTLIWGTVILIFSILPFKAGLPLTVGYFDKMAHFFEYTLLGVLVLRGIYRTGRDLGLENILLTLILAGGYGILMELVQRLVPGRQASMGDVAANVAGIVFGIVLGKILIWQK